MADYDNTNTFVLFVNNKKREGQKDPDRTGSLNVDGVEYFMDGWIKEGKNGVFLSGRIKRKGPPTEKPSANRRPIDDDDQIPF